MRIAIGCDHRGFELKKLVIELVAEAGHSYEDFGTFSRESVDYPDIAGKVGEAIIRGDFDRAILICGTGIGMCIAANKVRGIRAAQCYDVFTARRARQHNDAQVCCLAGDRSKVRIPAVVKAFLNTEFEGGRHVPRLKKIREIEER